MNIKSELNKPVLWFKDITFGILLFGIVFGTLLSTLIAAFGEGIFIKSIFLIIGGLVAFLGAYEGNEPMEEKHQVARKNGWVMVFIILVAETGLYYKSSTTVDVPIKVVVTNESRMENVVKDDDGNIISSKTIPYKKATFYDLNNNEKLDYKNVDKKDEQILEFYEDIVGKRIYIDYFPFLTYSEEYKYLRKSDLQD